jgi:hypothetical protein
MPTPLDDYIKHIETGCACKNPAQNKLIEYVKNMQRTFIENPNAKPSVRESMKKYNITAPEGNNQAYIDWLTRKSMNEEEEDG